MTEPAAHPPTKIATFAKTMALAQAKAHAHALALAQALENAKICKYPENTKNCTNPENA